MLVHLHPVHNSFFREAQRKMGKTPATLRSVDRGIAPSERCNRKLTLVHKDGRECEVEVRSYEDSTMVHADRLLTLYVKSGKVYTRIHVHMDDVRKDKERIGVSIWGPDCDKLFADASAPAELVQSIK